MHLEQIVPWGRSYDEYVRMFNLAPAELDKWILGVADGPASFNARMHRRGGRVISCDPIYAFTQWQIEGRIASTYETILDQVHRHREDYIWDTIASPEDLGRVRMEAMREFLADYPAGQEDGRYVPGELPRLPFDDKVFDLALCSHLLFLYTEHLGPEFHVRSVLELGRVARETRIFPLVDLQGQRSSLVPAVERLCEASGWTVTIERVGYEFQRGANEMMRIRTP